jgi:hypothetical protein
VKSISSCQKKLHTLIWDRAMKLSKLSNELKYLKLTNTHKPTVPRTIQCIEIDECWDFDKELITTFGNKVKISY